MRVIQALQCQGLVVGFPGDGVNDGPAHGQAWPIVLRVRCWPPACRCAPSDCGCRPLAALLGFTALAAPCWSGLALILAACATVTQLAKSWLICRFGIG